MPHRLAERQYGISSGRSRDSRRGTGRFVSLSWPRVFSSAANRKLTTALLTVIAAAHLGASGWFFWLHAMAQPFAWCATAGVVLAAAGGAQLRIAWAVCKLWPRHDWLNGLRRRLCFNSTLTGFVVCYAIALLVDNPASARSAFGITFGIWTTLTAGCLILSPQRLVQARDLLQWRSVRAVSRVGYWVLLTPLLFELGIRTIGLVYDNPIAVAYTARQLKLEPGVELGGRKVNTEGYWDKEFTPEIPPGAFRVAAIGDELVLGGDAETNFLALLERQAPGLEIYNFGKPQAGPRDYAAVPHEFSRYRPDLVLAFVSVGNDILVDAPSPGAFDWRSLYVAQLGTLCLPVGHPFTSVASAQQLTGAEADRQAFLRRSARQMSVCRTPIEPHMHQRWREAYKHLDQLIARCVKLEIPVAIVVAPSEFQINPVLRRTLQRRAGYTDEQIDIDLPQRRLAAYAKGRNVPLLDLAPHLRLSAESPFHRNDTQWNASGNALAADVLGHWMRGHFGNLIAAK